MGYASELGNYAEYSGAPNEDEVLQYARVVIDVRNISYLIFVFPFILKWSYAYIERHFNELLRKEEQIHLNGVK